MFIKLYHKVRYKIKCTFRGYNAKKLREQSRQEILSYYRQHPSKDEEIAKAIDYLKHNRLTNILIPDTAAYKKSQKVQYGMDSQLGIPYVLHQDKRMYFIPKQTIKTLKNHYLSLIEEQSENSPHLYTTPGFSVCEGDVLYDVGSAEGIFALSNIEKARHVVLFEADEAWLKVLQATFAPWKDKVTIVPKYVSDVNDEKNITIDSFIEEYGDNFYPDFIKADIEGAEMSMLKGMENCIARKEFKIAITTYHKQDDYQEISSYLAQKGFVQEASKGVTLLGIDERKPPFFRKALIRASSHATK